MDELERILKRQVWELASGVLGHPEGSPLDRSAEADAGMRFRGHERMFSRRAIQALTCWASQRSITAIARVRPAGLHVGTSRLRIVLLLGLAAVLAISSGAPAALHSESAPQVRVLRGVGKRVLSVSIARRDPVVVSATHTGNSNFIVHLVRGANTEYLINDIGPFKGQALLEEATPGRYRVVVDADGAWVLKFAQRLTPAKRIPGFLTGAGTRVIAVRATSQLQPVVTARHRGQSNFIVHLVGYGRQYGYTEYVFNELGNFKGQTLIEALPAGTYYVAVDASGGSWSIRFSR